MHEVTNNRKCPRPRTHTHTQLVRPDEHQQRDPPQQHWQLCAPRPHLRVQHVRWRGPRDALARFVHGALFSSSSIPPSPPCAPLPLSSLSSQFPPPPPPLLFFNNMGKLVHRALTFVSSTFDGVVPEMHLQGLSWCILSFSLPSFFPSLSSLPLGPPPLSLSLLSFKPPPPAPPPSDPSYQQH